MGPLSRVPFWGRLLLVTAFLVAWGFLWDFSFVFWGVVAVAVWIAADEWRKERASRDAP